MIRAAHACLAAVLTCSTALAQTPGTDDAGNRITPLSAIAPVSDEQARTRSAIHCNAGRDLCLQAWREGESGPWFLDVHQRLPAGADVAPASRIALPPGDDPDRETHTIWPHVIVESSGALLFGVERYRTAGFSGGGGSMTHLTLLRRPAAAAAAAEVLTVQTGYTAMIRACFTPDEYRNRGACHDEYELTGIVGLSPTAASDRPRLTLATTARSYPRGARDDGNDSRRYRRADLVWEPDPSCSYRRTFAFDMASGRYLPDQPLPDCDTYTLS
ncbi:MAG: hypothetical protein AB7O91_11450 [Sphingomonas sp.]